MKNKIIIIVLFLVIFSCTNEYLATDDYVAVSESAEVYTKNGVLHLPDDCIAIVDSVLALSIKQRQEWEEKLGFISYNTKIENLYDQLDRIETWDEFSMLVESNPQFMFLSKDSTIVETIEYDFYRVIANQNMEFFVGDTRHFLKSDGVYLDEEEYSSPNSLAILKEPWFDEIFIEFGSRGVGFNHVYSEN